MSFIPQSNSTKIIIVHSDNTGAFANYLQGLISSNDKYKDMSVGVFNDKQYKDNKPQISNVDNVIFIGNSKILSDETFGMSTEFNQYGMQYGWLGKRAYLRVLPGTTGIKDKKSIYALAKQYNINIDGKMHSKPAASGIAGIAKEALKHSGSILSVPIIAKDYVDDTRGNMYNILTTIFYTDALSVFLK